MAQSPIDDGQDLLEKYRAKLRSALENNELSTGAIETILASMQIDSGIYLSRNPLYEPSGEPFANFVERHRLPLALVDAMPKLGTGLYSHQKQGVESILDHRHTIIATGTGSGKTETFLIPIITHCLQTTEPGVKALIVYPMNALAGDQIERIANYTRDMSISFGLYTSATPRSISDDPVERKTPNHRVSRDEIRANPPDILITNYVMLDWMLTRAEDRRVFVESSHTLRFLVLDELHSYAGSKAAHLKYLLARLSQYIANESVFIGTSATLSSDVSGKAALDSFLQNLLGIAPDEYTFVEASRTTDEVQSPEPIPPLSDEDLDRLVFPPASSSAWEKAAASIATLTGCKVIDDFFVEGRPFELGSAYQALHNNLLVNIIRKALEDGAQSLDDLVRHISHGMLAEQFQSLMPERLLIAYLDAIAFVDEKAGDHDTPLLDYRVHIFLQNLTGILRMCPECHRYFSGSIEHCPRDGSATFAVYRHDVRLCIGKLNGQRLSPIIEPESTDLDNVHYALVGRSTDRPNDEFELQGDLTRDGQFDQRSDGAYRLSHLNATSFEQLERYLIRIGDEKRDYLYLVQLVKTLLQTRGKGLGFVDNRELASRYSAIIRDELAGEFLYEFLCLYYPREHDLELDRTLAYLQMKAVDGDASQLEQAVFAELPLWFYRMIAIPERMGGKVGLLKRRDGAFAWDSLSDLQQGLLDVFIRERAILTEFTEKNPNSHYIRFQKYWATSHYGIYIEDTVSDNPDYRGISLGERSREYSDFVERWSVSEIRRAVEQLVEARIIICATTPDEKAIYYVDRHNLSLSLPPSAYGEGKVGYEKLKKALLFAVEVHSSDLRTQDRLRIEAGLIKDEIQFVVTTPTLELGIDVGGLDSVLMIGAPPTPANYAQRAGRAGRGKKHDALIVTFCSAASTHDTYAFHNPRTIINGRVVPPAFNPASPEILEKHINAFVLGGQVKDRHTLRQFALQTDQNFRDRIPQMARLFGTWFDYGAYLDEFRQIPGRVLLATDGKDGSLAYHCYADGVFPDYGFRRDQVIAVDIEDRNALDMEKSFDWKDLALTTRDTEQAIRFFVPDQALYVAGDVYTTLEEGVYGELTDGARQYRLFFAKKEQRFAQQHKEIKQLDLRQAFTATNINLTDVRGVLAIGYTAECILAFRNHGVRTPRQTASGSVVQPLIGYDLKREAVVLRFDSLVCDEILRNSLAAVLVREINRRYELAEGELRLMLNAKPSNQPDSSRSAFTLLYDNDGNNSLRLERICRDFESLLTSAYEQLLTCNCETDGCYQCIRSYNTQHFDETLSKDRALMFTGYLIGKRLFEPTVVPFMPPQTSFDLILAIRRQHNEIIVSSHAGGIYRQSVQESQNDTIFATLTQAVYGEHRSGMKTLKIETGEAWLADAINHRGVNKGKEAFNRFQFALLKFDRVEAVRSP